MVLEVEIPQELFRRAYDTIFSTGVKKDVMLRALEPEVSKIEKKLLRAQLRHFGGTLDTGYEMRLRGEVAAAQQATPEAQP